MPPEANETTSPASATPEATTPATPTEETKPAEHVPSDPGADATAPTVHVDGDNGGLADKEFPAGDQSLVDSRWLTVWQILVGHHAPPDRPTAEKLSALSASSDWRDVASVTLIVARHVFATTPPLAQDLNDQLSKLANSSVASAGIIGELAARTERAFPATNDKPPTLIGDKLLGDLMDGNQSQELEAIGTPHAVLIELVNLTLGKVRILRGAGKEKAAVDVPASSA